MSDREEFLKHLKACEEVVRTWPKWKQNILGIPAPIQRSEQESTASQEETFATQDGFKS